jgi:hypothetical protein
MYLPKKLRFNQYVSVFQQHPRAGSAYTSSQNIFFYMSKEKEVAGKIDSYFALAKLVEEQKQCVERIHSTKPIFDKEILEWNEAESLACHCQEIKCEENRLKELQDELKELEEDIKKRLPILNRYILVQGASQAYKVGCFCRQVSNENMVYDLKVELLHLVQTIPKAA